MKVFSILLGTDVVDLLGTLGQKLCFLKLNRCKRMILFIVETLGNLWEK